MMVSKKKQLEEIIEKLRNLDQQHEKMGVKKWGSGLAGLLPKLLSEKSKISF